MKDSMAVLMPHGELRKCGIATHRAAARWKRASQSDVSPNILDKKHNFWKLCIVPLIKMP